MQLQHNYGLKHNIS